MRVTFEQIDPRVEQVALTLGCNQRQAFTNVALPQAWRGIVAAFTLAWARSLGEFGPILIFAGTTPFKTEVLASTVYLMFNRSDLAAAVAVSIVMLTLSDRRPGGDPRVGNQSRGRAMIEVLALTIEFPTFALRGVSFDVPTNSYCMLMGKTGSGKTTILESICGLRRPDAGTIFLGGRDITFAKPGERNVGYVPQDGALFPTMRIRDQIEFAMRLRNWPAQEITSRVDELAELLEIGSLLTRKPLGLSGGERQRVALARALAFRPRVLCLDEPLSALDEATRRRMYQLLQRVHLHERTTALHVTHNSDESQILGTHVLRLQDGDVVQVEGNQGDLTVPMADGRRGRRRSIRPPKTDTCQCSACRIHEAFTSSLASISIKTAFFRKP